MQTDRYGHALTTGSPAASASWNEGADRFLAADCGALEAFERAVEEDEAFALAHTGLARVLQLRGRGAEARAEARRARELAAKATERERSHVDALATMIEGDAAGALARIRAHVARYPRDAFALQPATQVFGLIGFSGRSGREQEVFDLLAPLAGDYGDDWWHLAIIELRSGNPERMWAIYSSAIAPGASAAAPPLNTATDAASLLWRAALDGERVAEEQWHPVRMFSLERFPPTSIAFLDVHRAIACAMAGDPAALDAIVHAMRDADAQGKLPTGSVSPDAVEGLAAFARGDDEAAIRWLAPCHDDFVRIGGSHAQRDLFTHTLVAAYLRNGRVTDACAVIERTPWRAERGGRALIHRASPRARAASCRAVTLVARSPDARRRWTRSRG